VTADEGYGGDTRLRAWLERRDLAYVLAVKSTQPVWAQSARGPAEVAARTLVERLPARAWRRLSAGAGAKGPRTYDSARVALTRPSWPRRGFGCWRAGGCRTGS
jgi:SRSO17 transposase